MNGPLCHITHARRAEPFHFSALHLLMSSPAPIVLVHLVAQLNECHEYAQVPPDKWAAIKDLCERSASMGEPSVSDDTFIAWCDQVYAALGPYILDGYIYDYSYKGPIVEFMSVSLFH